MSSEVQISSNPETIKLNEEILEQSMGSIVEELVDSVLDSDSETVAADPEDPKDLQFEKVSKFSDGLSFIKAFKSRSVESSPVKSTVAQIVNQKWQIWYWRRSGKRYNKSRKWEDFLQMKSSFTTKDEFCRAYNELNGYEFGLLSSHFDYCVFKDGIKPMWEDPANRNGGRWIMEFPRKKDWKHISHLDTVWLKVLLAISGSDEALNDYIKDICGVVLMIRFDINKMAVWTTDSANTLVNLKIGELLRLSAGFGGRMYYQSHQSSAKSIEIKTEHRIRFKSSENLKN